MKFSAHYFCLNGYLSAHSKFDSTSAECLNLETEADSGRFKLSSPRSRDIMDCLRPKLLLVFRCDFHANWQSQPDDCVLGPFGLDACWSSPSSRTTTVLSTRFQLPNDYSYYGEGSLEAMPCKTGILLGMKAMGCLIQQELRIATNDTTQFPQSLSTMSLYAIFPQMLLLIPTRVNKRLQDQITF